VLLAVGVGLVPFAIAVDAFDQTEMMTEVSLPPPAYAVGEVVTIPVDPPIVAPATVDPTTTARRGMAVQVAETVPAPPRPLTAREVCNSLTYIAYDPGPSGACFRAVTAERGWSPERIESWFPFIVSEFSGVIQGESAHCWNVRRGEIIEAGEVCNESNKTVINGPHDDAGFGQATSVWHGRNGYLCKHHGYCGVFSVIASPYDSMLATIVLLIEHSGSDPWCWSVRARDYHDCWEAPDR
jgi:hypothetical protein